MNNNKGFTLIEMIVVIIITGIFFSMLAVIITNFVKQNDKIQENKAINNEIYIIDKMFDEQVNKINLQGFELFVQDYEIYYLENNQRVVCFYYDSSLNELSFLNKNKNLQVLNLNKLSKILFYLDGNILNVDLLFNQDQSTKLKYRILKVSE